MVKDYYRIFIKCFFWIAPINAILSVVELYMQSGWLNEVLEWVVGILNFPTIWFIVNYATSYLKSPNVTWYIATVFLSLLGSLLWALLIALVKEAAAKKQVTEQVAGNSTGKR